MECNFNESWVGKCTKEADESGYCEKHKGMKCVSCDSQATHTCSVTSILVCGAPLCDECEHEYSFRGTCSHDEGHIKKKDQKYTLWISRNMEEENVLKNDFYPQMESYAIHQIAIIELISRMKEYRENPDKFSQEIKKIISEKENKIYEYMKKYYPSSIANNQQEKNKCPE